MEKNTAPFRKCWHIHNNPHGTITCKAIIWGFNLRSSPTKNKILHTIASVHKLVHPYSIFQSPHVSVIQHPLETCSSRGTEFRWECTYVLTTLTVASSELSTFASITLTQNACLLQSFIRSKAASIKYCYFMYFYLNYLA